MHFNIFLILALLRLTSSPVVAWLASQETSYLLPFQHFWPFAPSHCPPILNMVSNPWISAEEYLMNISNLLCVQEYLLKKTQPHQRDRVQLYDVFEGIHKMDILAHTCTSYIIHRDRVQLYDVFEGFHPCIIHIRFLIGCKENTFDIFCLIILFPRFLREWHPYIHTCIIHIRLPLWILTLVKHCSRGECNQ